MVAMHFYQISTKEFVVAVTAGVKIKFKSEGYVISRPKNIETKTNTVS